MQVDAVTTHGFTSNGETQPEYLTWCAMHQRCENPKNISYSNYGGRGIKVCKRWGKFENFISDMGFKPSPSHTIERRDNDKGYSPSNCVWATWHVQSRNKRRNVTIRAFGRTRCLSDWAKELGIGMHMITQRIKGGMTPEDAMTIPTERQLYTAFGKTMGVTEWSRETGINRQTISARLKRGWAFERAIGGDLRS